jgi:RNA polymerase subunit RPABC4/transcription elongation factor Spt4
MDKMAQRRLQEVQTKKAEYLIELGKILSAQYRAGQTTDPEVEKLCTEIVKLDAQIGSLKGTSIDKNSGACPQCKQPIVPGAMFCPSCGFGVQEFLSKGVKYCGICGGAIVVDSLWCPICGAKQD